MCVRFRFTATIASHALVSVFLASPQSAAVGGSLHGGGGQPGWEYLCWQAAWTCVALPFLLQTAKQKVSQLGFLLSGFHSAVFVSSHLNSYMAVFRWFLTVRSIAIKLQHRTWFDFSLLGQFCSFSGQLFTGQRGTAGSAWRVARSLLSGPVLAWSRIQVSGQGARFGGGGSRTGTSQIALRIGQSGGSGHSFGLLLANRGCLCPLTLRPNCH